MTAQPNDWTRIKAALDVDPTLNPARRAEIWRWTTLAREWLDEQGIEVSRLARADALRFVDEVPPTSGPRNQHQRIWALSRLAEIARNSTVRRERRPGTFVARLDKVPERSVLGKAVAQVLAGARTQGDRRRWEVCLGAFLRWCDARGIPASDCWDGDLTVYRRDRLASGYRSPGEYLRVAGLLLARLTATLPRS